jgi:hypothetical protein
VATTRPEEQFAFTLMSNTLGVDIFEHDDNSAPRMVDGHFALPDGRLGAVEVTTAADSDDMKNEAMMARLDGLVFEGLNWSWHVWVGKATPIPEIMHHLPLLFAECERQGVIRMEVLSPVPDLTESYTWFFNRDISVSGAPDTKFPGRIYMVAGSGGGGAVPDNLDGFAVWLEEALAVERFKSDLDKLDEAGREEKHLFLRVHEQWMPFKFDYLIAWSDVLPTEPFDPPGRLTGLWLATRWKNPVLYWTRDAGWARTDLYV